MCGGSIHSGRPVTFGVDYIVVSGIGRRYPIPMVSTVGFSVGCTVEIEGGGNSETGFVASIGSLVLTSGLTNGYPAGTTIVTLTATAVWTTSCAASTRRPVPSASAGRQRILCTTRMYHVFGFFHELRLLAAPCI